ncbi:MAG: hypothetical protein ACKOKH_06410 [Bacteroidota bacterium]
MISKALHTLRPLAMAGLMALTVGGNSCQKQKVEPQPNLWIPAPLRNMFDFKPGSYWMLTLPGTSFVDSVYVTSRKMDTLVVLHPGSRDTLNFRERLTVQYRSLFYGYNYLIEVEGGPYCFDNENGLPCYSATKVVLNSNNSVRSRTRFYYYPEFVGSSWPIQSGALGGPFMRLESIGPLRTSDSTEWSDVRRMVVEEDPFEQGRLTEFYVHPNLGLLGWAVPVFNRRWGTVRSKQVR